MPKCIIIIILFCFFSLNCAVNFVIVTRTQMVVVLFSVCCRLLSAGNVLAVEPMNWVSRDDYSRGLSREQPKLPNYLLMTVSRLSFYIMATQLEKSGNLTLVRKKSGNSEKSGKLWFSCGVLLHINASMRNVWKSRGIWRRLGGHHVLVNSPNSYITQLKYWYFIIYKRWMWSANGYIFPMCPTSPSFEVPAVQVYMSCSVCDSKLLLCRLVCKVIKFKLMHCTILSTCTMCLPPRPNLRVIKESRTGLTTGSWYVLAER